MALRLLRNRSASSTTMAIHHHPNWSPSARSLPDRLPSLIDRGRTYFTATQAAAALRPFYFAVHPDLFGLYPEMYKTNEQSLKALHGYIDGLYTGGSSRGTRMVIAATHNLTNQPRPITLKFFVRDRKKEQRKEEEEKEKKQRRETEKAIKSVQVNLRDRDPCAAVRTILESCDLSTEHLPKPVVEQKLPWRTYGSSTPTPSANYTVEHHTYDSENAATDEELMRFWSSTAKKKKSRIDVSLHDGLRDSVTKMATKARFVRDEYERVEMDVRKKMDEIKSETGLRGIEFNLSWTLTHCRGCLQQFKRAFETNRTSGGANLKGWILKFALHGTYVSLDRSIVLGVDDLPSDWFGLINNLTNRPEAYYQDLPSLETRLSDRLGNGRIDSVASADTPLHEYRNRLIALTRRLSPSSIDCDYAKLRFIVENDACALSILDDGRISVPYTIASDVLEEFLTENYRLALESMENFTADECELNRLRAICEEKLGLRSLDWGEHRGGPGGQLNRGALRSCLERLAELDDETDMRSILDGHRLHIGSQESYVLLPDGRLSIPCDWRV